MKQRDKGLFEVHPSTTLTPSAYKVSRGDIILINPNPENDPSKYGYWKDTGRRDSSEFVIFIADVDTDMVVEGACGKRQIIPATYLKRVVFKSITNEDFVDPGPH